jgi:hypothetical protein
MQREHLGRLNLRTRSRQYTIAYKSNLSGVKGIAPGSRNRHVMSRPATERAAFHLLVLKGIQVWKKSARILTGILLLSREGIFYWPVMVRRGAPQSA